MDKKMFFLITGSLFLVIAVLHVFRLVLGWEAVIGGFYVPMWVSVLGVLLPTFLSFFAFKFSKSE